MSQKVAYVTGGMGGIGTAICQRLHRDGLLSSPAAPHARLCEVAGRAEGPATFHASVGNVADWDSTVRLQQGQGRARHHRRWLPTGITCDRMRSSR